MSFRHFSTPPFLTVLESPTSTDQAAILNFTSARDRTMSPTSFGQRCHPPASISSVRRPPCKFRRSQSPAIDRAINQIGGNIISRPRIGAPDQPSRPTRQKGSEAQSTVDTSNRSPPCIPLDKWLKYVTCGEVETLDTLIQLYIKKEKCF
jgi:hypothetical protein